MERRAQILNWLKEIICHHLYGTSFDAFVFGSQANGSVLRRSDIDVGIMGNSKIPDTIMAKIITDIENLPMLFNIDVIDFYDVDEKFKTVALSNIEKL